MSTDDLTQPAPTHRAANPQHDVPAARRPPAAYLLLAAGCVGALAFAGDQFSGIAAALFTAITSSGASWGMLALAAGWSATSRASAARLGCLVLVVATVSYYVLTLAVGQRWRLGTLEDGQSAWASGLTSIGLALGFWLLASLFAGPVFGLLGNAAKSGTPRWSSLSVGFAFGLLSSQGWYTLVFQRIWMTLDDFGQGVLAGALAIVALSVIAAVSMLLRRQPENRRVPLTLASALISSAAFTLCWYVLDQMRSTISI